MVNGGSEPGLEIVDKSNAIVVVLEEAGELTAAEVARRVDEPLSSTYRLLTSLTEIGWVERGSKRGRYRLGIFFMKIGGQVEGGIDIRERALPSLRRMLDESGATSYLCVRHGTRGVCVERLEGRDVRSMALRLGDSLPLNIGAAPLALLAFQPAEERKAVIDLLVRDAEVRDIPFSKDELQRELEGVRASGYAVSDGNVTRGVAALGAPVFNHRGEIVAAISASGLRDQILGPGRNMVELVTECAEEVSDSLGYRK